MRKILIYSVGFVLVISLGLFIVTQNSQITHAQTAAFNQVNSAMINAMNVGNTKLALHDEQITTDTLSKIMTENGKNSTSFGTMINLMKQNDEELSAMMSSQANLSAMSNAMHQRKLSNATRDFRTATNSMYILMKNKNLKHSKWFKQMSALMNKNEQNLTSMMAFEHMMTKITPSTNQKTNLKMPSSMMTQGTSLSMMGGER